MKQSGKLTVTTPSDREVVLTRVFDAPRKLVFETMTKPELVQRWLLGPPGWSMVECQLDFRVGGAFRYAWRHIGGGEMAMHGVYRQIAAPERVVNTEVFEMGCEPGEQLVTSVLVEERGQTTLTCTVLCPSKQARDATIASGMEGGVGASYDRLEGLLVATPAQA